MTEQRISDETDFVVDSSGANQGCTDGNCKLRIGPAPGQHTNGGCKCLRDVPTKLRLQIERKLASVRCETCGHAATVEGCPACLAEEVARLRKALEDIETHQLSMGGTLSQYSATLRIARKSLGRGRPDDAR